MTDRVSVASMTRTTAKTTFLGAYACGFVLALLVGILDLPEAVRIPWFVIYVGVVAGSGTAWLVLAVRDRAIARALPQYLWRPPDSRSSPQAVP